MSEFGPFLIVRSDDLVVLGVQLSGFELGPGARPDAPHELQAQSDQACVMLIFPPQAIAEQKYRTPGDVARREARLAGPSRVEFTVPAGTRIPLDAQGILSALSSRAQFVPGATGDVHTAMDLPWHLITSARARSAAGSVLSDHPAGPVNSPAGVSGLWRARLRASDARAGDTDAELALLPLHPEPDEPGLDFSPLSEGDRQRIVSESAQLPPMGKLPDVKRLELSALGGSLSARLAQPNFQWDHDTSLGRDQRVRVVSKGLLYPFGHRAELQVMTERIFDPPGAQSVAGLHRTTVLVVTEPLRDLAGADGQLARQFPFSAVEILARSFTDLRIPQREGNPWDWQIYQREPFPSDALQAELNNLSEQEQALTAQLNERLAAQPQNLQQMFDQGFPSAFAFQDAQNQVAMFDPDGLLQQQRDIDEAIDRLQASFVPETETGADGETIVIPGAAEANQEIQRQITELIATRPSNGQIQAARIGRQQAEQAAAIAFDALQNEFNNLPRTIERLAELQDEQALQVLDLRRRIGEIQQRIRDIAAVAEEKIDLFFTPHNSQVQPLLFPLRCAGAQGDVRFAMPLIFVNDLNFEASLDFPAFASQTDPEVASRLAAAWGSPDDTQPVRLSFDRARSLIPQPPGARSVPLPGVRIDMVRSLIPQPGDLHEVHALSIAAIPHAGGFLPRLAQFEAELPALRKLLPDLDLHQAIPVQFTDEFLNAGERVEAPLKLVNKIVVDFTNRADRSGGLVSPKFAADVISRTLGPVPLGALPKVDLPGASLPDLSSVYDGATLLGFPLASVIKVDGPQGLPEPPKIIELLEKGKPPGVRMEWKDLKLKSQGPFRADDTTKLDLAVESSLLKTETTCMVESFSLILPPTGPELLTLTFQSLVFTQQAGRAPDLQIHGLKVNFEGALALLQKLQSALQEFLDLGDNAPTVRATSSGITASYALNVPSVQAGAFLLSNIAMRAEVDVPFDRHPVTVSLSFARRDNPFNLSVLMFGGGGYIDLQIGPTGITRLEASLEFGARVGVDFIVASGEVHALGGVRFVQRGGSIELDAFLRFGGSVEVLGLVSVSVELVVALRYESEGNRLVGRATLVLEIDLTLYSDSVELDSGEWVLSGSEHPQEGHLPAAPPAPSTTPAEDPAQRAWRAYQGAFAS